jgi:hypothetical protein
MDNLKQLQEMKSALERQISEAIESERARQRAIEEQQARLREAEIAKVQADVQMLMRKYDLTSEDVLGIPRPPTKSTTVKKPMFNKGPDRSQSLREIRSFYEKGAKV